MTHHTIELTNQRIAQLTPAAKQFLDSQPLRPMPTPDGWAWTLREAEYGKWLELIQAEPMPMFDLGAYTRKQEH